MARTVKSDRRKGDESADTRTAILDATEKLMREDGYAAVSSRKVAERAGLKSLLVYYHFGTMDELFLALYHREEEKFFTAHAKAMASKNPIRALWQLSLDESNAAITQEFIALANHRKAIRAEIARSTQRFRCLQTAVFAQLLKDHAMSDADALAEILPFFIVATACTLVGEEAMGISTSHAAIRRYVERYLDALEHKSILTPPIPTSLSDF
jgi:AcrR family transcriptional regulator